MMGSIGDETAPTATCKRCSKYDDLKAKYRTLKAENEAMQVYKGKVVLGHVPQNITQYVCTEDKYKLNKG